MAPMSFRQTMILLSQGACRDSIGRSNWQLYPGTTPGVECRIEASGVALSGTAIFIFVLTVAAFVGAMLYFRAKRRKDVAEWAAGAGLTFSPNAERGYAASFPSFGCLHRGHSRYAYNVARGTWNGRPLEAFDYRYVTGHGKNRTVHDFSAIILGSHVPLKPLTIRSENAFDKVTEFFGADDIDFESDEFSRRFFVKSPDKKWAYDVLHQRTMEFLLAGPRFSIEFDTHHVICWHHRRFDRETRENAIGVVEGILDRLPDYLVRAQQKGDT
jgi:hypothetical protein